jgi:hypothetical protein
VNRDKMKKLAIKRLKEMKLLGSVTSLFSKEDRLYYSERINKQYSAVLNILDENEELYKKVKEFEERTGYLVYHCILTQTTFGTILDMLFISKYEENWEYDYEKMDDFYRVMSMATNLSDEMLSDMGSILVRPSMGGLERIG